MTPGGTGREGKVEVHVLEGYVTVQNANVNQGTNSLLEIGLSCDNDGVSANRAIKSTKQMDLYDIIWDPVSSGVVDLLLVTTLFTFYPALLNAQSRMLQPNESSIAIHGDPV